MEDIKASGVYTYTRGGFQVKIYAVVCYKMSDRVTAWRSRKLMDIFICGEFMVNIDYVRQCLEMSSLQGEIT